MKAAHIVICIFLFGWACAPVIRKQTFNVQGALIVNQDSAVVANCIERMDTHNLAEFVLDINIHFIEHRTYGTFYRGLQSDTSRYNGLFWSTLLVNHANWLLDVPGESPISLQQYRGDLRYNYRLYSDPDFTRDSFGGIWFWPEHIPDSFPYGDRVLNIVFLDDGTRMLNGSACGLDMCSSVTLYGAYYNLKYNGKFGWWSFAALLNHEVGHLLGLCHSFYCDNECAGIDLDPSRECFSGPCFMDCGGPNNGQCNNWLANSNNMMGYNANQNALTPCQWKRIMHTLYATKAKYVHMVPVKAFKTIQK